MSSVSRSRVRIFEWLALLVAWLSLSSPAHAGTTTISWNDFGTVLPADCDMINAKVENNVNSSAIVEFVLDTGANIGWYKGLQIVDNTNQQYLVASTGASSHTSTFLPTPFVSGGFIRFEKARILGVHTGVYDLIDLTMLRGGDRVTFSWIQDACQAHWFSLDTKQSTAVPTWMTPGSTARLTYVVNTNSTELSPEFHWQLFERSGYAFTVPWIPVTTYVPAQSQVSFDITLTAPMTEGLYELDLGLGQKNGLANPLGIVPIQVRYQEPKPPPPPPPPAMVTVPDVVGQPATQGASALSRFNTIILDFDRVNPNSLAKKSIIAQTPIGGSKAREHSNVWIRVELDNAPTFGYSHLELTNCKPNVVALYKHNGDDWTLIEKIMPSIGDGNVCPKPGSKPFVEKLDHGAVNLYVVVDAAKCTDASDPNCRIWEFGALGDSNGGPWGQDFQ